MRIAESRSAALRVSEATNQSSTVRRFRLNAASDDGGGAATRLARLARWSVAIAGQRWQGRRGGVLWSSQVLEPARNAEGSTRAPCRRARQSEHPVRRHRQERHRARRRHGSDRLRLHLPGRRLPPARMLFNAIVHQFLIPGIQIGTRIDVDVNGEVGDIRSNVRLVLPHTGCLRCNGLISGARLPEESMGSDERERNRYVDEVPAPSVITFNTLTAGQAASDFMLTVGDLIDAGARSTSCASAARAQGRARAARTERAQLPRLRPRPAEPPCSRRRRRTASPRAFPVAGL